jgi:predicted nucleic acid-binding protein
MSADVFLDTNVLVYAVDSDAKSADKRLRARQLIREIEFGISAQVLQEFYVTVTRKLRTPLPVEVAVRWVERLSAAEIVPTDTVLVKAAIERSVRSQISYWDAAIITAAEAIGATTLYTEDLNHGQLYGSVRAIDPFRD